MKKVIFITILLSIYFFAHSNTVTLTFEDFIGRVKSDHPLALQADLKLKQGDASVRTARGNFDPKLFTDASQKSFSDKQYYSVINSGLKIPTWYGVELSTGYTQNDGLFLNPQNNTPGAGLWYAGISVPIGQGLFIDQRRAELKQAKIYQESTIAERDFLYNKLLYDAGQAYWNWFENYNSLIIYQNALEITQQRFEAVKQNVLFGDKPAIDTTESAIQVQNRILSFQEAELNYKNATALLSVYLWMNGTVPLEIDETTRPTLAEEVSTVTINQELINALDSLSMSHPLLRHAQFKINQLQIDKKLKQEQIKPQIDLKYNAINQPIGNDASANYNINNYTWGVAFSMPIFLRKERGDLAMANLKINDAELEYLSKQANLTYKAIASLNDLENTKKQITLYARTVNDYSKLLDGEKKMFNAGESSLFMINSRESGYIKTQLKYIQLLTKNHIANLAVNYNLGILKNN